MALAKKSVKMAVAAWGQRQLSALDAEDRLSVACEKGVAEDEVTLALRQAYQVGGCSGREGGGGCWGRGGVGCGWGAGGLAELEGLGGGWPLHGPC
jgi:hypothetical protein